MKPVFVRLIAVGAAVTLVASCDTRLPTTTGITGSSTTSATSKNGGPTIVIDSPLVGTLINTGDSVLVSVRLHDAKALKSAVISGLTEKGSVDLGTFTTALRYRGV